MGRGVVTLIALFFIHGAVTTFSAPTEFQDTEHKREQHHIVTPQLSLEWKGAGWVSVIFGDDPQITSIPAKFEFSQKHEAYRVKTFANMPVSRSYDKTGERELHLDTITMANKTHQYSIVNGVCKLLSAKYGDPLTVIKEAKYVGDTVIRGTKCEKWVFTSKLYNSTIYVAKADTAVPVRVEGRAKGFFFAYDILMFRPNVVFAKDVFKIPEICTPPGVVCKKNGTRIINALRIQPFGLQYTLGDANAADLHGGAAFICMTNYEALVGKSLVIVMHNVLVNASWGNYDTWSNGVRTGFNGMNVGRMASFGLTKGGGQCHSEKNPELGNWYSFPKKSRCPEHHNIGYRGCTWMETTCLGQMNYDILQKYGMEEACIADGGFPFTKAMKVFEEAFVAHNFPCSIVLETLPHEGEAGISFSGLYGQGMRGVVQHPSNFH